MTLILAEFQCYQKAPPESAAFGPSSTKPPASYGMAPVAAGPNYAELQKRAKLMLCLYKTYIRFRTKSEVGQERNLPLLVEASRPFSHCISCFLQILRTGSHVRAQKTNRLERYNTCLTGLLLFIMTGGVLFDEISKGNQNVQDRALNEYEDVGDSKDERFRYDPSHDQRDMARLGKRQELKVWSFPIPARRSYV